MSDKLTPADAAAKIYANFLRGCVDENQGSDCKRSISCREHQKAVAEGMIRSCIKAEQEE